MPAVIILIDHGITRVIVIALSVNALQPNNLGSWAANNGYRFGFGAARYR
ncbi:hypothetical protein [Brevundimonas sp.]